MQCLTKEGKRRLLLVIGGFEKLRFRQSEFYRTVVEARTIKKNQLLPKIVHIPPESVHHLDLLCAPCARLVLVWEVPCLPQAGLLV